MTKLKFMLSMLILSISIVATNAATQTYIIRLDESNNITYQSVQSQADALAADYKGTVVSIYESIFRGFAIEADESEVIGLSLDSRVFSISENITLSPSATQTNAPWSIDRIDQRMRPLDNNYVYTNTGTGVTVYIIDSGINFTHTEFGGRASLGYDGVNDGQNGNDCYGHGTHVAALAGGSTYGAAKGVTLKSVRAGDCTGFLSLSRILGGIEWIINSRAAANDTSTAVANFSMTASGPYPDDLRAAITSLINSNVVVTHSAGNNSLVDSCTIDAHTIPNVISVGGMYITSAGTQGRWGSFGSCIDIFAPAAPILSAWIGSTTATHTLSGTSLAAPLTAGVIANYLQSNPTATVSQVNAALINAATPGEMDGSVGVGSPNLLLYSFLSPPSASTATVSGQVTNGSSGIAGVVVVLTDSNSNAFSTTASSFGYYSIADVPTGRNYVVTASKKNYSFSPTLLTVNDDVEDYIIQSN